MAVSRNCRENADSYLSEFRECEEMNDIDESNLCPGHRSRIILEGEVGVKYYVVVAGVTPKDVGTFQLTIGPYYANFNNDTCKTPYQISIPTEVDGNTKRASEYEYNINNSTLRGQGYWYRFTAVRRERIFISTCNNFVNFITHIFLFLAAGEVGCETRTTISTGFTCGIGQQIEFVPEIGQAYDILILGTSTNGQFLMTIRNQSAVNTDCQTAVGIITVPFSTRINMNNYPSDRITNCSNYEMRGAWYSIMGDGQRYVFSTCGSHDINFIGYDTGIEIYFQQCNAVCGKLVDDNCGSNAYISTELQEGEQYYIRVTCRTPNCFVTFEVWVDTDYNNCKCESPLYADIRNAGDVISNTYNPETCSDSLIACKNDEVVNRRGGWYMFVGTTTNDITIEAFCKPMDENNYIPVIEIYTTCRNIDCLEKNSSQKITFHVPTIMSIDPARYLFVTAQNKNPSAPQSERFSMYNFYATVLPETTVGTGFDNPIVIQSIPFTRTAFISSSITFKSLCNSNEIFARFALYFKYLNPPDVLIMLSTCGPETQFDSAIELIRLDGGDVTKPQCVQLETSGGVDCAYGARLGVQTTSPVDYFPVVIDNIHFTAYYGSVRFSVYDVDSQPPHSKCLNPMDVTVPFFGFEYIHQSQLTRIDCEGVIQDGIKGVFYRLKADKTGILQVTTSDVSEIPTQIVIFSASVACMEVYGENVPQKCVMWRNTSTGSHGIRGVNAFYGVLRNEIYLIFVGAETAKDSGIFDVSITISERDNPSEDRSEGNPYILQKIVWIIFGLGFIAFVMISAILFGIMFWRNNRIKAGYGTF